MLDSLFFKGALRERKRERESGKTNMFIYLCKDKQNQKKKITNHLLHNFITF